MLEIPIEFRPQNNLNIELLSQLIKYGFDSPEKLALYYILKDKTCRVHTHNKFNDLREYLADTENINEFSTLKNAIRDIYNRI